jgi:hypothetical protein
MSISSHFSYFRHITLAVLATTLFTGCSEDGTVVNPNIEYTDSYKVEYVPGMMAPMQGKTQFQIRVSDKTTGDATTGETVTLMPMMYMTDKTHSTPVDGACIENTTAGTYDCTVFYVMADNMDGVSTGHWELKVMIGGMMGESVMFYPSVDMAMGGTAMVKLKHESLTMTMMGTTSVRTFQVFKSGLTGTTGDHAFELFTSTMETMMSFPSVYPTVVLNADTMPLTIDTMTVRVSSDPAFVNNVHTASQNGNGYWTATGLTGLVDGTEGMLYVEVTINGNILNSSIDGVAGAGINNYATFTVTPGV